MQEIAGVIKDYGINAGILIIVIAFCWWLLKYTMKKSDEISNKFFAEVERHEHFLENHIHENTEAMKDIAQTIKDLNKDQCREHGLILEKLK